MRRFPNHINFKANLISCDVVSLYTSIPTDLGIQALDYWIEKLRSLIPSRFTKVFILELARFVLSNNYFRFEDELWHQLVGTAMGSIFAPPYACLTMGFLEETRLYPVLLPSKFDPITCQIIIDYFFRFMDDGTTLLPEHVTLDVFLGLLNSMDPSIRWTITRAEFCEEDGDSAQRLVFLSLILFLSTVGKIWTDVFYKETNTHDYLRFDSHHPVHVKKNIPFVLAKRILVFTTREKSVARNLRDLVKWLGKCGYPQNVIDKGIHNARIQGPAPLDRNRSVIPLISTFYSNYSSKIVVDVTKQLIKNSKNERVTRAFQEVQFVNAYRQPPNLLRELTHSKFLNQENTMSESAQKVGLFKCKDNKCKICRLYIQEGSSFVTSNGTQWSVKCFANCNSLNAIYFQRCKFCSVVTNIGKTGDLRERTNNHISCCRHGTGDDVFDKHVHECANFDGPSLPKSLEPFFYLNVMMVLSDYDRLLGYESRLHACGHDTINKPC